MQLAAQEAAAPQSATSISKITNSSLEIRGTKNS